MLPHCAHGSLHLCYAEMWLFQIKTYKVLFVTLDMCQLSCFFLLLAFINIYKVIINRPSSIQDGNFIPLARDVIFNMCTWNAAKWNPNVMTRLDKDWPPHFAKSLHNIGVGGWVQFLSESMGYQPLGHSWAFRGLYSLKGEPLSSLSPSSICGLNLKNFFCHFCS